MINDITTEDWLNELGQAYGFTKPIMRMLGLKYDGQGAYFDYPCQTVPEIQFDAEGNEHVINDIFWRRRILPSRAGEGLKKTINPTNEDNPFGNMPALYFFDYKIAMQSVRLENDTLVVAEGDKDYWTLVQNGILNSGALLSTGVNLDNLVSTLKKLGAHTLVHIMDNDTPGLLAAQRIKNRLAQHNIRYVPKVVPRYTNQIRCKDLHDMWMALDHDNDFFMQSYKNLQVAKLPTEAQIDYAKDNDIFNPKIYEDIDNILNNKYKRGTAWAEPVACPVVNHEHDDTDPAFLWNRESKIGYCFKCGQTYLTKEVASALNLNYRDYINNGHQNDPIPSIDVPITPPPLPEQTNSENLVTPALQLADSILSRIHQITAYEGMPEDRYMVWLDDALEDYTKRLHGLALPEYPPMMNPIRSLHHLGGLAHVIKRPAMVGILGASGGMKCVTGDTRIQTEKGYLPIKHFATGNPEFSSLEIKLLTPNGERYTSHFYDSGVGKTKKIITQMGYELTGTYNHPIQTLDSSGQICWKRLDEIKEGDYVVINRDKSLFGNETKLPELSKIKTDPTMKFYDLPTTLDIETAYVLGILTSDGGLTQRPTVNFTSKDVEPLDALRVWAEKYGMKLKHRSHYSYAIHSSYLFDWISNIGLDGYSYEKHIPECIFKAPEPIVRSYLQGLFDTDGTAPTKGKYCVGFSSSSEQLAKDVHLLLLQFGIISKKMFVPNKHKGSYHIIIRGEQAKIFFEKIGFQIQRKQEMINRAPKFNTNNDIIPYLPLVDVTKLPGNRGQKGRQRSRLRDIYSGRNRLSYTKLKEYQNFYPEFDEILKNHYYFDLIKTIDEGGEQHCYDFTVPIEHAFISNGFVSHNTTLLQTMVNTMLENGEHGILYTPEWSPQQVADRIHQQHGGLRMDEMALLERYNYEQMALERGLLNEHDPSLFGRDFSEERIQEANKSVHLVQSRLRGKLTIINQFGANAFEVLGMVMAAHKKMTESGFRPSFFVFDYAQLALKPKGEHDWTTQDLVTFTKVITLQLGLVTYMSSQVTKDETQGLMKGKLLSSTAGLYFRDDQFNLFLTTNPQWETMMKHKRTQETFVPVLLGVWKNSNGAKAITENTAPIMYANLDRMIMIEADEFTS